MEAFKDMAAKEGICIAHSGKDDRGQNNHRLCNQTEPIIKYINLMFELGLI